mmetsp:Transcript_79280/g.183995  ORF Transcript_79280/g.183995 Transcript_79280/m.183995 type:complete len:242 (-) Transcript_79280:115-840(-)|eukprot:CAMPEP_0171141956 /NCGR_PEP_ID=MMETSP0766_2-20121228/141531_1 /TAXON_ID=439317 /ORGANISM="Gambierdiscus australes, Strain CAWD 149" /LENGTH=241 /DNA_ID=CAMNT_0011605713 /DNA_START=29 /DNA_END=754 /DNA_ORIENTATION=-
MDPESGSGVQGQQNGDNARSTVALLLKVIWERLQAVLGALSPKTKDIGVENRFYFDEVEKVWKLRGGETEQERAESEALRFHTSRGLTTSLAPPTTACDASRAEWSMQAPPPPPMSGPVTHSTLHASGASGGIDLEAYAHPVYAPAASFAGSTTAATPSAAPPVRPSPAQQPGVHAPRTSPFGGPSPLTSPFVIAQQVPAVASTPLASPFGVAGQPRSQPMGTETPLASPFGALQPPQQDA